MYDQSGVYFARNTTIIKGISDRKITAEQFRWTGYCSVRLYPAKDKARIVIAK